MNRHRSEELATTTPRWLVRDVDAISAECLCGYRRELPLAPLLERYADMEFPTFARRLCCSECGAARVEARPARRDPMQAGRGQ